jgi:hypothetical protein
LFRSMGICCPDFHDFTDRWKNVANNRAYIENNVTCREFCCDGRMCKIFPLKWTGWLLRRLIFPHASGLLALAKNAF